MLNAFTKTKPWMVASLLAATSIFAQDSKQQQCRTPKAPDPMPAPMTAAYNAPARVDVRGSWDFYVEGSFIYWQPLQDNMEIGISSSTTDFFGTTDAPVSNTVLNLNTNYKPGFQVTGGMNYQYDNWDNSLTYTWFHNTNTSSASGTIWPTVGHPGELSDDSFFNSVSASWNLKMDVLDWVLARSSYVGTKLTFRPYFGLRAAWIRQRYNVTYDRTISVVANVPNKLTQINWGIGPETGLTANYLFGYGLRIFGDVMGDVLYTHYHLKTKQTNSRDTGDSNLSVSQTGYGTLRAHTSIDLGAGWATYFDNNNWHFDLMALYGFQVFWDQNANRKFVDDTMQASSIMPSGNLYVHGLTITARLDF